MAEAIAHQLIAQHPDVYGAFTVDSAGILCAGASPASSQAVLVAAQNGCDLSQFTAKQLTPQMADQADYIFVMTRRHKSMLDTAMPQHHDKVFLLNAYAALDATPDISDPFGGDEEEYRQCFAALQSSIAAIFAKLAM